MSVLGHISLKFHPSPLPSHTVSILQDAGWRFPEGSIYFQHYASVEGIGNDQQAPVSEWERIKELLDSKYLEGETVSVRHEFWEQASDVWFCFRQEADHIQEMWTSIQESGPRLSGRFTDFGWYLPKIVCPLYEAGHNILEVSCHDDAY